MFIRPDATYDFDPSVVLPAIRRDEANPLKQIAILVPDGAKVLDIGAGNGLLAMVLADHGRPVTIDGIEPNPHGAQLARSYYRRFYTGPAEDFIDSIRDETYDVIVLADVLEHLNDPLSFLGRLSSAISEKGKIIMTVPNVAFGTVRINLLHGNFDYVDSGILERTHLRFFTLKTLRELTGLAGMYMEKLYLLRRNLFNAEPLPENLKVRLAALRDILKDELATTYQFLVMLSKKPCVTETAALGERIRSPFVHYLIIKLRQARFMKRLPSLRATMLERLLKT